MNIFLETDRLFLRQFTEEDADKIFELDSDPEVVRYVDPEFPPSQGTIVQQKIPQLLEIYRISEDKFGFWAVVEKASSEFVGWFHFLPVPNQRNAAEIGYRLKRSV